MTCSYCTHPLYAGIRCGSCGRWTDEKEEDMNRDDIIRMARQAGGGLSCIAEPLEHPWKFSESELIRFAALVAAAEREACAKVCEEQRNIEWVRANIPLITHDPANTMASKCAAAIRARSKT